MNAKINNKLMENGITISLDILIPYKYFLLATVLKEYFYIRFEFSSEWPFTLTRGLIQVRYFLPRQIFPLNGSVNN